MFVDTKLDGVVARQVLEHRSHMIWFDFAFTHTRRSANWIAFLLIWGLLLTLLISAMTWGCTSVWTRFVENSCFRTVFKYAGGVYSTLKVIALIKCGRQAFHLTFGLLTLWALIDIFNAKYGELHWHRRSKNINETDAVGKTCRVKLYPSSLFDSSVLDGYFRWGRAER